MRRNLKKIFLYFGIFLLFLWGGFHLFFQIDTWQEKRLVKKNAQVSRLSPIDIEKIQEGDIILRRGYGFFSDIIAKRLNNEHFDVTHSGILYRKNNHWWVIHSLSTDVSAVDGVQTQSLDIFLKHSVPEKILIVRPNGITLSQGKEITERAKYYLNKKIPFDHLGIIDDTSELYCSELIYQILDNDLHLVAFPTGETERKEAFYTMQTLYDPRYFSIVVNTYPKEQK